MLAVQGLTAEEKEKPKPPTPIIEEHKLMKSIPSTIRAVNDTTATQTIDIPLLHTTTTTQQIQLSQLQNQTQTTSVPQQQQHPQQHHVQTQIQHIQVHQNISPATTTQHQVSAASAHHTPHQQHQQIQVQHQVHHTAQQQQSSQAQQVQVTTQPAQLSANIVTLPAATSNSLKKRKITFSDDDDNIYTTETVDEQTIVKSK